MMGEEGICESQEMRDRVQNRTYPAQVSIASANIAVARDIVSSADW